MEISGARNSCIHLYKDIYEVQKNAAAEKSERKDGMPAKAENTGKAGNAAERCASDYYSYLQKNYDCISKGKVKISGEYLKKCSGDAGKARELEAFLKEVPELEKQGYEELSAQNRALGGTVTYYQQSWMVHRDGSIQGIVYSVTDTGMTNAERTKKNMDERLEKLEKLEKQEKKKRKEKEEKIKIEKERREEQAEKPGGINKISVVKTAGREITVRYMEAESRTEAGIMMRKERLDDAYHPEFDRNI